jgi:hypothetical protein
VTRAALAAVVAAVLVSGVGLAAPALADEQWPTEAEVQAAKQNAAASEAEYNKIQGLVQQNQATAVAAAATALAKQNDYAKAEQAYQQASDKAASLQSQADAAKQAAADANRRFGSIASQLYVAGGNSGLTTQLLLDRGKASELLDKLSAMSRLTGLASGLRDQAAQQANVADALSAQAADAQQARKKLAGDAQAALTAAQAAQKAADDALARSQAQSQTAYAQMAELKQQSAELQQKDAEHKAYLAALARQRAAQSGDPNYLLQVSRSITPDPAAAKSYAHSQLGAHGWGEDQWGCLVDLWTHESGWRVNAYNTSSAAYGIPQAWPGQKMATYGDDWMTNYVTQINWGLAYIKSSYGSPCAAWSFEMSHTPNWY